MDLDIDTLNEIWTDDYFEDVISVEQLREAFKIQKFERISEDESEHE